MSTESSSLLLQLSNGNARHNDCKASSTSQDQKRRICNLVCIPSKAATFIILSSFVVGLVYYCALGATKAAIDTYPESLHLSISVNYAVPYALLVLFTISYPLSGFIADVCCGKYKTILCSFFLIFTSLLFLCTVAVVLVASKLPSETFNELFHYPLGIFGFTLGIFFAAWCISWPYSVSG